jgi:signal-transduction protein with cAMP-binding, CBS, and nucleotidyltransferase domain
MLDLTPTPHRSLDEVRVDEVMHRGVITCPVETPLSTVARLLAEHRVHCVVGYGDTTEDDTGVWGVVSDHDLVSLAAVENLEGHGAFEAAATEPVTVPPAAPLRRAAQLMREHGVSHVLVEEQGADRPIGVVSTLDIAAVIGGVSPVRADDPAGR